ncbi:unnamed protein product [Closterium sp. Naga37s-1]|nr:unnamed protein product [Closterium sp. Naga37s-1]
MGASESCGGASEDSEKLRAGVKSAPASLTATPVSAPQFTPYIAVVLVLCCRTAVSHISLIITVLFLLPLPPLSRSSSAPHLPLLHPRLPHVCPTSAPLRSLVPATAQAHCSPVWCSPLPFPILSPFPPPLPAPHLLLLHHCLPHGFLPLQSAHLPLPPPRHGCAVHPCNTPAIADVAEVCEKLHATLGGAAGCPVAVFFLRDERSTVEAAADVVVVVRERKPLLPPPPATPQQVPHSPPLHQMQQATAAWYQWHGGGRDSAMGVDDRAWGTEVVAPLPSPHLPSFAPQRHADVGGMRMLGACGCWGHADVGGMRMLGACGCWGHADVGGMRMLGACGCWGHAGVGGMRMLGACGCWGHADVGGMRMLGACGCWGHADVGGMGRTTMAGSKHSTP